MMIVMKISTENQEMRYRRWDWSRSTKKDHILQKCRRCKSANPPYKGKKFEKLQGKWYPQCASTVSRTLSTIHNHKVTRWGPVMAGPSMVANPRNRISAGCAYSEVRPKGVAYLYRFQAYWQRHTRQRGKILAAKLQKVVLKGYMQNSTHSWWTLCTCL